MGSMQPGERLSLLPGVPVWAAIPSRHGPPSLPYAGREARCLPGRRGLEADMADRLTEGLSFEWRAERLVETLLQRLSTSSELDVEQLARVSELAASARARRVRLERRLEIRRGPARLAPMPRPVDRIDEALESALALTRASADRYAALAELSRRVADAESAFACELNRIAAEEASLLLDGLLGQVVERIAWAPVAEHG